MNIDDNQELPRSQMKRMGLPVDPNPHDHTQGTSVNGVDDAGLQPAPPSQQVTNVIDPDDYTFTDDGLKDGVSVGSARRNYMTQTPSPVKTGKDITPSAPFSGGTLGDVENYLRGQLGHYQSLEESDEEKAKRERRERRERNLSAIGDILGSFHRAYSHQRGVQPMELPSLSQKAQDRFDKAKALREKNRDKMLEYALKVADVHGRASNDQYKAAMLAVRRQDTERKLAEGQAKIDRLVQQGKTEEARQAYYNSLQLWYAARAEGQEISNKWAPKMNQSKINLQGSQASKAEHDAARPYTGGSGKKGGGSGKKGGIAAGTEKVTEKTDARGRKTTTVVYNRPRQTRSTQVQNTRYPNTRKLGL